MNFDIQADKFGKPYLKKAKRPRNIDAEGRGDWITIGPATYKEIEHVLRVNREAGYIVLPDERNTYWMLILTE
jgi:hypothetical protein